MNTNAVSNSNMPISNTAATLYDLIRGIMPNGDCTPRGVNSDTFSPTPTESFSASRLPITIPVAASKPSSVPCLMLLATGPSLLRSSARMPRTITPSPPGPDDASSLPSTMGAASVTPGTLETRSATCCQSVSGRSSGWIKKWPFKPRIFSRSSLRKPLRTAITMMSVATPSMMPRKEKPALTEMNPSRRRARR